MQFGMGVSYTLSLRVSASQWAGGHDRVFVSMVAAPMPVIYGNVYFAQYRYVICRWKALELNLKNKKNSCWECALIGEFTVYNYLYVHNHFELNDLRMTLVEGYPSCITSVKLLSITSRNGESVRFSQ